MLQKIRGFTLVEVCITIAIIGIIVAIGAFSWSGYNALSEDRARVSSVEQWASTFDLYKSRYHVYPEMPTGSALYTIVCLGDMNTFPTSAGAPTGANRCGQYRTSASSTSATTSTTLVSNVKKMGRILKNPHEESGKTIFESTLVGPIAYITRGSTTGTTTVTARFVTFLHGACANYNLEPYNATVLPHLSAFKPASGSGSSANLCYLERSFTYNN